MRKNAGTALKKALGKILGVFDARARLVFIDRALVAVRRTLSDSMRPRMVSCVGKGTSMPVVEENEQTIAPEIADLFDREANAFATEVLFQLDSFSREANSETFGILVPVRLSKKYGASIYAAVRRYVSGSSRPCAVLILDPPTANKGTDQVQSSPGGSIYPVPPNLWLDCMAGPFYARRSVGSMVPSGIAECQGNAQLS